MAVPTLETKIVGRESVTAALDGKPVRCTILVLKSNETLALSKYRRDGDMLLFEQLDGTKGAVSVNLINWLKTTESNQIISTN